MRGKDYNTGLRGVLFESRHYERMGAAVWLYGWLVLRQTHQHGSLGWVLGGAPVSYREIEEETGFNSRTLERWMQVLRRAGYIETETAPGGVIIRITKAKKFPQGARNSADRIRKAAEACPQKRVAPCSYLAPNVEVADRIDSSSLGRSQERRDTRFIHKDFHRIACRCENSLFAGARNPSCLGQNQKPLRNLDPAAHQQPRQQGDVPSDARLLRQLLRAERDEAVRRELAVGTGPEVRRS